MKGYIYLKNGLNGDLEPKTIIRTEHISEYESFDGTKDYDYYIFENDNMFHRCNKDGRLGAKYQDRFLNYKVLNKEFEMYCVLEEPQEHKIPEKIFLNQDYGSCYIDPYSYEQVPLKREKLSPEEVSIINKINEILDYLEVTEKQKRNKIIKEKR